MNLVKFARIQLEEFNDCPGKDYLLEKLSSMGLLAVAGIAIADSEQLPYFKNDSATLVMMIGPTDQPLHLGIRLGQLALDCGADEITYGYDSEVAKSFVRIWWD